MSDRAGRAGWRKDARRSGGRGANDGAGHDTKPQGFSRAADELPAIQHGGLRERSIDAYSDGV
jgi:hypothetical protein